MSLSTELGVFYLHLSFAGDFEGATGTITWGAPTTVNNNPGIYYTFKLSLTPNSDSTSLARGKGNTKGTLKPATVQTEAAVMAG
jgi:hypothetical protein